MAIAILIWHQGCCDNLTLHISSTKHFFSCMHLSRYLKRIGVVSGGNTSESSDSAPHRWGTIFKGRGWSRWGWKGTSSTQRLRWGWRRCGGYWERGLCLSHFMMKDPWPRHQSAQGMSSTMVVCPPPALSLLYHCWSLNLGPYLLSLFQPFCFQNKLWHLTMPWPFHQQKSLYVFVNLALQPFCLIRKE